MIIGVIARMFGYSKQPSVASVQLAMWIKNEAGKELPNLEKIANAADYLEQYLRSARL
jgi:hypothetical protein